MLYHTVTNIQNTANTSAARQAQLFSNISSQLDNISKILNTNLDCIDEYLTKSCYNQNLMHDMMKTCHVVLEQWFASIKAQLARLEMNPQAPIVPSPQPHRVQYQAVLLLEPRAATTGPPPLSVPPLSRHIYNVTPFLPSQHQGRYQLEMVAGKVLPPAKFHSYMKNMKAWILEMNNYFTIIQTCNEQQQLAYLGLCTKEEALGWWKPNRYTYTT